MKPFLLASLSAVLFLLGSVSQCSAGPLGIFGGSRGGGCSNGSCSSGSSATGSCGVAGCAATGCATCPVGGCQSCGSATMLSGGHWETRQSGRFGRRTTTVWVADAPAVATTTMKMPAPRVSVTAPGASVQVAPRGHWVCNGRQCFWVAD